MQFTTVYDDQQSAPRRSLCQYGDINDVDDNIDDDLDDDTDQGSLDQAKPCEEGRQDGCQVQVIQVIINIIDNALFHSF